MTHAAANRAHVSRKCPPLEPHRLGFVTHLVITAIAGRGAVVVAPDASSIVLRRIAITHVDVNAKAEVTAGAILSRVRVVRASQAT